MEQREILVVRRTARRPESGRHELHQSGLFREIAESLPAQQLHLAARGRNIGKLHLQQPVEESGTQRHARAVQLGDGGQPHRGVGTPLLVAGQRQGLLRNFRYSILPVFPRRSERQPQDHAGRKSGHRRAALRRLRTGLRQLDLDPLRPSLLLRRQQRHARLDAPNPRSRSTPTR